MRIKRLDLARYGQFTDLAIDFGEHAPGTPDLHVIYSPDEAGKAAVLNAWLDLLYGMAGFGSIGAPDNGQQPRSALRIEAALQLASGERQLVRIHNNLLDEHGRPAGEQALHGELAGMDREACRSLFSLSASTLVRGGEGILAAGGELGPLLFSATSGLAGLGAGLVALQSEADAFHRPGQSGELEELAAGLAQLAQERVQLDTEAETHAKVAEALRTARARHNEASAARSRLQARREEIQRVLKARPWIGKLRTLREQLAPLAALPDAPAGWQEALPALREAEIRLDTQLAVSQAEVERLEYTAAAISIDVAGCELSGQLQGTEALRSRYLAVQQELPGRREALAKVDQAIGVQLRKMERGEDDPERLLLPAATVERLRELMEQQPGVAAAVAKSAEELSEAQQRAQAVTKRLETLTAAAPQAGPNRQNLIDHLTTALEALRGSDHAARRRQGQNDSHEAQQALADALIALQPWRGQPDQLLGMAAPEAEALQRWTATQEALHRRDDHERAEIERLTDQCAQLSAEHEALSRTAGQISDHQAAVFRAERDQAWAKHRSQLDARSADEFEQLLRSEDTAAAQRLADIAQLSAVASGLAAAQSDLMQVQGEHAQTLAESDALNQDVRVAVATLYPELPESWTLPQLEGWLTRRDQALAARLGVQTAARDIKQSDADGRALMRRLAVALQALEIPLPGSPDEAELDATAQAVLEGEARIKALQQELEERERVVQSCERAFSRAANRRRQWDTAWQQVCASCCLGDDGKVPTMPAVRGFLACLPELADAVNEYGALAGQIELMEQDGRAFEEAVCALADGAGIRRDDEPPVMQLVQRIEERTRQAQAGRARKSQEAGRLAAARESSRALAIEKQAHARHKQEMMGHLGVTTLTEGAARLAQIATRDRLRQELAAVEQQLLTTLRQSSASEAEAALGGVEQNAVEHELAGILAQWDPLEQECRDSYDACQQAQRQIEAIGGDAAVARIEERRQTLLIAINEGVQRHVRLRAGLLATEAALRLYRERYRSSMLAGAAKALRVISRGSYTQLTTRLDGSSEVLAAVAADLSSQPVTELPQAARTQLYLALRLAGYLEVTRSRPPIPVMADDVMSALGELRPEEALPLFTVMAAVGQVIYLTRHREVCDAAREVCPGVQIHRLPGAEELQPAQAVEPPQAAEPDAAPLGLAEVP